MGLIFNGAHKSQSTSCPVSLCCEDRKPAPDNEETNKSTITFLKQRQISENGKIWKEKPEEKAKGAIASVDVSNYS